MHTRKIFTDKIYRIISRTIIDDYNKILWIIQIHSCRKKLFKVFNTIPIQSNYRYCWAIHYHIQSPFTTVEISTNNMLPTIISIEKWLLTFNLLVDLHTQSHNSYQNIFEEKHCNYQNKM